MGIFALSYNAGKGLNLPLQQLYSPAPRSRPLGWAVIWTIWTIVMTNTISASESAAVSYPPETLRRAGRAANCSPFRLKFFQVLKAESIALQELTDSNGILNGYTRLPLGELAAENELMWLLAVGLLRREVDGQGLTDSFRLTPLGRQLLEVWQSAKAADLEPSFQDHLYNFWGRWLRLPSLG